MSTVLSKIQADDNQTGLFTWVDDGVNKDRLLPLFPHDEIAAQLESIGGWKDPYPPISVSSEILSHDRIVSIIREDELVTGAKTRFADDMISRLTEKTVVYVAPREGYAPITLAYLCERYRKRLVLFCPAAKTPSPLQALCADLGAELRFVRIAAMPVLNKYAREWAASHAARYFAPGLHHPMVTAGIVRSLVDYQGPKRIWVATSTGTLSRAIQIAWPETEVISLLVARSMQAGELGRAIPVSTRVPFLQDAKILPPYPSPPCYDAKLYEYVDRYAEDGDWVFNVGGIPPEPSCASMAINSQREWHDLRDLDID